MDVKGKTVCVTGVLAGLKRSEAEAGLSALGARVTGSVSKGTDLLFVGAQPGSKLARAQALGITVANEAQLLALLGNKTVSEAKLTARADEERRRRELEAQALAGDQAPVSSLKDKTVVVTGTLSVERDEIEAMLRRAGALVTGSVSKHTDFLVVGAGSGSKLAKAKALGVQTLTEAQVREAMSGAVAGKATSKPSAKPAKAAGATKSVEDLCAAIEAFFEELKAAGTVELRPERLAPTPSSKLDAYEAKFGVTFPSDLRAFLERGLNGASGSVETKAGFASFGFDFLGLAGLEKTAKMFRKIADELGIDEEELEDDDELAAHDAIRRHGIWLTHSEPQLVWHDGWLYHYSGRNPVVRVCDSWTCFLEAWLASGCFSSHAFDVAWNAVKGVVGKKPEGERPPVREPAASPTRKPVKNVWVDYYRKNFPTAR